MKIIRSNRKAFSIIISMGLVVLISITAIFILDYMIPFSRDIKGIENSSNAYYQANAGVEDALWELNSTNPTADVIAGAASGSVDSLYGLDIVGSDLPPAGKGNSEYDNDWNILRQGDPIQLDVGNISGFDWNDFEFYVKVPDLDRKAITAEALISSSLPIINWQLTSTGNALNASGSYILDINIDDSLGGGGFINLKTRAGIELDDTANTFQAFYDTECGTQCILKLSIINNLEIATDKYAPYLEWKVSSSTDFPLRYRVIESTGLSHGFRKDLRVRIPQTTVNEAFDFTIFQ